MWHGAWCGGNQVPNPRGTNVILVDPFTCSKQVSRNFDTHISSAEATRLSTYLQQDVNHGQIVVVVSADEPRKRLDNALSTLRQFGVDVSDLTRRGSFGFVAQKGFPSKTVLRKVRDEQGTRANPPHFTAAVGGM